MKYLNLFLVIVTATTFSYGRKVFTLTEAVKPSYFTIMKNKLLLSDNKSVQLYSIEGEKFARFVGKIGIGPGEYTEDPLASFLPSGEIIVRSYMSMKILNFTNEGNYMDEHKLLIRVSRIEPINKNYTASRQMLWIGKERKSFNVIVLYDSQFNSITELYREEFPDPLKRLNAVGSLPFFSIYKEKIFISKPAEGLAFDVFDKDGRKIESIKQDYRKDKIPEEFKTQKLEELKKQSKDSWPLLKNSLFFPDCFPAVCDFAIYNDKIYARTWIVKENNVKFAVISLKGDGMKYIYLPAADRLYAITEGKYFYLKENPDQENWELHSMTLN